jgi:phage shock protein PspC (stress-responsive transcriptional regulator)
MNNETTPPAAPRLERPADGRVVAGVAQGLANRLDVPVAAVRAGFIVTALLGGPGIAAYIGGVLLMPSHNQTKAPAVAWVERVFDGKTDSAEGPTA